MTVTIQLKNDSFVSVENFEHVVYNDFYSGEQKITKDAISKFIKKDDLEYTFVGESIVSIKGSEILYIIFDK
ncbi:hypothetical protein IGJ28_000320 [Enterococcus sp. AZ091]|uniref:hypothetical protein n=1 Tax=Enterococcus TaxID=1350 RepID=UPI002091CC3B|nr:hypothetical protein [Enterococcus gallinarum]MCO5477694.1 hypothetical protein [Enterococcus gallinarum]